MGTEQRNGYTWQRPGSQNQRQTSFNNNGLSMNIPAYGWVQGKGMATPGNVPDHRTNGKPASAVAFYQ
ncbi:hypothetical protein, partial [Elizabethkingia miricola]|uniref:hypothetical protein n=1 Tax=Elizabethkingia miricola TaxID=172045 RepID=UPI003892C690